MEEHLASMLSGLTARMCSAQGPSQALVLATQACAEQITALVYAGLAVMAADKQAVQFHAIYCSRAGSARLAPLAPAAAAAAIAIETKQAVNVRDIANGDLGLQDLQYLQQEHDARSFFGAPLVIADTAPAVLCLAADQPSAFAGQEDWLLILAAMCAPYVALLRSHQQLVAMESFVSQVIPVRAALQLRGAAAQSSRQSLDAGHQHHELRHQQQAAGPPDPSSPFPEAEAAGEAAATQRQLHSPSAAQHQQRQQRLAEQLDLRLQCSLQGLSSYLTFRQPHLERAYRLAVCRQWQQWLDGLFLLLTLLAAVGAHLLRGLSGNTVADAMAALVVLLAVLGLLQQLQAQPFARYLAWRAPLIAAVRLLHVAAFCWRLSLLPAAVFSRPGLVAAAGGASALVRADWSQAEASACGVLLVLGLMGLLHPPVHAAVQFVCVAVLVGVLQLLGAAKAGPGGLMPVPSAVLLVLLGWGVPVSAAGLLDWRCRVAFLHRLR